MHSSPPETRASLIVRLQDQANREAWDEFMEIYAPVVFRLARSRGLQTADADDLVQEVLAAVARSISDWLEKKSRGSFRAWLFAIARNTAIDFLTRRKHRPLGAGGDSSTNFEAIAGAGDVPSDFDIEYRRQMFSWASGCVRKAVSESTWQAFWLTSVEQHSAESVAEELGQSVGSIYIARSRVMKRLRKLVVQQEESNSNAM